MANPLICSQGLLKRNRWDGGGCGGGDSFTLIVFCVRDFPPRFKMLYTPTNRVKSRALDSSFNSCLLPGCCHPPLFNLPRDTDPWRTFESDKIKHIENVQKQKSGNQERALYQSRAGPPGTTQNCTGSCLIVANQTLWLGRASLWLALDQVGALLAPHLKRPLT